MLFHKLTFKERIRLLLTRPQLEVDIMDEGDCAIVTKYKTMDKKTYVIYCDLITL